MAAHWQDEDVLLGGRLVHVKRGQVLFSARKKAQLWDWSRNTSLDWFRFLEAHQMVSREVSHGPEGGYTLLTILNYGKYQNPDDMVEEDELSHGVSHDLSHDRATPEPPTDPREEGKKSKKKERTSPASGLTLADYLNQHTPEGQEVIRQAVEAIATTRKSGKIAESVLDALAKRLSQFPAPVVLHACRVYVERRCAAEGKAEAYLVAIARNEAKRQTGQAGSQVGLRMVDPPSRTPTMNPGQRAIALAMAAQAAERGDA
jgi:hypothetical protein